MRKKKGIKAVPPKPSRFGIRAYTPEDDELFGDEIENDSEFIAIPLESRPKVYLPDSNRWSLPKFKSNSPVKVRMGGYHNHAYGIKDEVEAFVDQWQMNRGLESSYLHNDKSSSTTITTNTDTKDKDDNFQGFNNKVHLGHGGNKIASDPVSLEKGQEVAQKDRQNRTFLNNEQDKSEDAKDKIISSLFGENETNASLLESESTFMPVDAIYKEDEVVDQLTGQSYFDDTPTPVLDTELGGVNSTLITTSSSLLLPNSLFLLLSSCSLVL